MTSSKAGVGVLLPLLLSLLLLAVSNSARAVDAIALSEAPILAPAPEPELAPAPEPTPVYINDAYADIEYWGAWAIQQGYQIDNYTYSEGSTTGVDGVLGNEFICIRDDANQVIIGRPDVCGTYYSGLGYSYADITNDPTSLTDAPDIIDAITDNLVDQNLANWGGCNYTGQNLGGTNPGGPQPNCGADIINWSYQGYWVYRRHAIEQALKAAGVNVDGYTWEFRIKNNNGGRADQSGVDILDIHMIIWDNSGNQMHRKTWRYDTKFDWTTFSGTELFTTPLAGQDLRDWQIQMYSRDTGFWAGYYGPEMNTPDIRMIYSSNPCAIDPLLHPDCEGYVDAYANWLYDQQCSANPLYDSGCPGYQQAYYDQQCNANPLYDVGCPNYAQAYYDQQCSFNPLYDIGCPGYEQAYYDLQCTTDPLYDSGCPGYAQAYLDQQCSIDPLYDSTCDGYAEAYYDQQCSINPLYDSGCPGYETAYYDYQCSLSPLYDTGCNGYEDAYYAYQCSLDALYDTQCPGYAQAYYDYQCSLDALYDNQCPGYAEAYAQEYILNDQTTTTTETTTTISTPSSTDVPITDPEQIAMPSATGDSTIDSILGDLNEVPTTALVMESSTVETMPAVPETQQTEAETETASETDSAGEMEELVASVEAETESSNDSESTEDAGGSDDESSDESEGKDSNGGDSKSEKKDSKREKLKKEIAKKAQNLANEMSSAASLEAQQAAQATVLALINYVPDFNTYSRMMNGGYLPDAPGYADTQLPETKRGLRNGLAQQLLHEKMVEMQYDR